MSLMSMLLTRDGVRMAQIPLHQHVTQNGMDLSLVYSVKSVFCSWLMFNIPECNLKNIY